MDSIRALASRQIYQNNWLTIREDDIQRPDGSHGIYAVVDKPTYALVIPRDGHRFHLVEQFRYPLGLRRWEFPQGTAPDRAHLEPAALAARELREETGLTAATLTELTEATGWLPHSTRAVLTGLRKKGHVGEDGIRNRCTVCLSCSTVGARAIRALQIEP